jgi:hypothetical protein
LPLLTGCGTYGDFGRVRPSLVNDDIHAWIGPAAAPGPATNLAWRHQLTDEERMLRDLAYPLIEPAYDRQRSYEPIARLAVEPGCSKRCLARERTDFLAATAANRRVVKRHVAAAT